MRLLLASQSAARRRMLEAAGVPFQAVVSGVDEATVKAGLSELGAAELAEALAEAKAGGVAAGGTDLVLGSDQTLETETGSMLDKPRSRDEAAAQLRALGGTTHRLHSAAVIVEAGERRWHHVEAAILRMRPLSDQFIESYLDAEYEAVRWSVGCYHVEGRGAQLFERIEGSHFAVLGMPLLPLLGYLRERGVMPS